VLRMTTIQIQGNQYEISDDDVQRVCTDARPRSDRRLLR
jgi:hypothetical protein